MTVTFSFFHAMIDREQKEFKVVLWPIPARTKPSYFSVALGLSLPSEEYHTKDELVAKIKAESFSKDAVHKKSNVISVNKHWL